MMVDAVCFDLMDTLVADPFREALRAGCGLPLEEIAARRDPHAWPAFEAGEIDEATFAARVLPDGGFDLAACNVARRRGYTPLPGMLELLDELEGCAARWIASNYPVWVDEVVARFDLDTRVEGITVSCRAGVRKPDPGFYDALLADTGVAASRCLLVDDRPANCEAARQRGLRAHHFVGVDGLRDRLGAEGVLAASRR